MKSRKFTRIVLAYLFTYEDMKQRTTNIKVDFPYLPDLSLKDSNEIIQDILNQCIKIMDVKLISIKLISIEKSDIEFINYSE